MNTSYMDAESNILDYDPEVNGKPNKLLARVNGVVQFLGASFFLLPNVLQFWERSLSSFDDGIILKSAYSPSLTLALIGLCVLGITIAILVFRCRLEIVQSYIILVALFVVGLFFLMIW